MDIEIVRDVGIDLTQERQKFFRSVLFETSSDDFAGRNVERSEQRRGTVPLLVMGTPFSLTWSHWQEGLGPIKRLDLALFIDAQHQGALGRVEIEPDDVPHLLDD